MGQLNPAKIDKAAAEKCKQKFGQCSAACTEGGAKADAESFSSRPKTEL